MMNLIDFPYEIKLHVSSQSIWTPDYVDDNGNFEPETYVSFSDLLRHLIFLHFQMYSTKNYTIANGLVQQNWIEHQVKG